jgi:DNA-directed RNA polymerase subunit beta
LDKKSKKNRIDILQFLQLLDFFNVKHLLMIYYGCCFRVKSLNLERYVDKFIFLNDIFNKKNKIIIAKLSLVDVTSMKNLVLENITSVDLINISADNGFFYNHLLKSNLVVNSEKFYLNLYKILKSTEFSNSKNIKNYIKNVMQNFKNYDLSETGRYRINKKLNIYLPKQIRILTIRDVLNSINCLVKLKLRLNFYTLDDIDDLSMKRVRSAGSIIFNQFKLGLLKTERSVRERLVFFNISLEVLNLQKLIYPKNITVTLKDFFARSSLSQFMDQINPLSEITHKRRLTSLGPGGLNRERASFEVRDVHPSYYGKICPIETPEGPNIGLISSLSLYSQIDALGFITTPYVKVNSSGIDRRNVFRMSALDEQKYKIMQFEDVNLEVSKDVIARYKNHFIKINRQLVDYADISFRQIISVATALIPFIEHNDANRSLMGSNMQRQGVPLLISTKPLVGTGLEAQVTRESRSVLYSSGFGRVLYVDSSKVLVDSFANIYVYRLIKFMKSNSATCYTQNPIVKKNEIVYGGCALCDGASSNEGILSLGHNVLVSFMSWYGYNFEDSIVVSDNLIRKNYFSSIHVEEFELNIQETKLGSEEITRDIPNTSKNSLLNLDSNGIIKIGSFVRPGDILIGKVTPQNEVNLSPEEKLLKAVVGERSTNVKNSSLVTPHGIYGFVTNIQYFTESNFDNPSPSSNTSLRKDRIKKLDGESKAVYAGLHEELTNVLSNILLGEKIPLTIFNKSTGDIIIPAGRKITKTLLRKLSSSYEHIEMKNSPLKSRVMGVINQYKRKFFSIKNSQRERLDLYNSDFFNGTDKIRSVRVYIAIKHYLSVGDKISGRHGNKGVVSKVVRFYDMPFTKNGIPVDIILSPLGVPSRMNVGQVLEMHMGFISHKLGIYTDVCAFNSIKSAYIKKLLFSSKLPVSGKFELYDGLTGNKFAGEISLGFMYIIKLNHLSANKIHSRAVGPYSLITQQPLGGKSQYGGQRFGEMEV